jgi:hypothetical protein
MARPTDGPDGWWLAILWVVDDTGVVSFRDAAPRAGLPPDPPLARLGPPISGALSGLISRKAAGSRCGSARSAARTDLDWPWLAPIAVRAAFRFERAPRRCPAMRSARRSDRLSAGDRRAVLTPDPRDA